LLPKRIQNHEKQRKWLLQRLMIEISEEADLVGNVEQGRADCEQEQDCPSNHFQAIIKNSPRTGKAVQENAKYRYTKHCF